MGRVFSLGLGRVLRRIIVTSAGVRHKTPARSEARVDPVDPALPTGERRILEHVAMMSVEKRLKMPR